MSSHHIVREKQEPALVITGLDNFEDELLGQLLEWSPTVIVTADTAESMQTYGIKIDWLVANSLPEYITQSDIKLIPTGNGSALTTALKYLTNEGYPSVNIIANEWHLDDYINFADKLDMVIFYNNKKISVIRSGFKKWKPAGERIEFLTVAHNFVYNGLFAESDTAFSTIQDGFIDLNFSDNFLFISEPL